jgi:hypothetical protein
VDPEPAPPTFFVARDRARRFTRYIREALQERRLNYRGADVGMTSLVDEADENLSAVAEDARTTLSDILGRRMRDRERGYMEAPLVALTEGVIERVDLARRLDRALVGGSAPVKEARAAVLALLDDALVRLDAYCGSYDEKRPIGPRRSADLAHLLIAVEQHAAWERMLQGGSGRLSGAPYDKAPPTLQSDPHGLEDLLRAARAAVPASAGPWEVRAAGPEQPLLLSLGEAQSEDEPVPAPERLVRAAEVLAFLHPVAVECVGRQAPRERGLLSEEGEAPAPEIHRVRLHLADEAAGSLELSVAAAAGPGALLSPAGERAVRALLDAPPVPSAGPPPPQRLIALLGLLRTLDESLVQSVLGNLRKQPVEVGASRLPREDTRKAPLKRAVFEELEARFPGFPSHRVEEIASAAAGGKLAARHMAPLDAAVVLALFARSWHVLGRDLTRSIRVEPLEDEDVEAVVRELIALAGIRRELEAGRPVAAGDITRLERATIAVLGRLGRVPA